jgi:hypothetical protein
VGVWDGDNDDTGAQTLTFLRSSNVVNSGLSPPWIHKNCLFMIAASGRAQNDSAQAS